MRFCNQEQKPSPLPHTASAANHWVHFTGRLLGAAAYFTDLEKRFLGEGTLQARYLRGASGGKPFTLGKYESTRTRVTLKWLPTVVPRWECTPPSPTRPPAAKWCATLGF